MDVFCGNLYSFFPGMLIAKANKVSPIDCYLFDGHASFDMSSETHYDKSIYSWKEIVNIFFLLIKWFTGFSYVFPTSIIRKQLILQIKSILPSGINFINLQKGQRLH